MMVPLYMMVLAFIFSMVAVDYNQRVVRTGPLLATLFFYSYAIVTFIVDKLVE